MNSQTLLTLLPPRLVSLPEFRVVGLSRRYNAHNSANMPQQWFEFSELQWPQLPAEVTYGLCYNSDGQGNMSYLTGVEVTSFDDLNPAQDRLTVPAQTYAVFHYLGHIAEIKNVWQAIWNQGLAEAKLTSVKGIDFEKYGPEFDPSTGTGGYEIWLPVQKPVGTS